MTVMIHPESKRVSLQLFIHNQPKDRTIKQNKTEEMKLQWIFNQCHCDVCCFKSKHIM